VFSKSFKKGVNYIPTLIKRIKPLKSKSLRAILKFQKATQMALKNLLR